MTQRMSAAEYRSSPAEVTKRNKFGAKKTVRDGIPFDSKKEADRWSELCRLEKQGLISHLERQPKFKLMAGPGKPILIRSGRYKNGRQAVYTADFSYFNGENRIVEDVKSKATRTEAYVLRKAIVEAMCPAVKIVEV